MKIVVTGGAGFIGSHLCERLLNEDHEVICIDNFLTGSKQNIEQIRSHPHFSLIEHDVTQPLAEQINCQAIFHMASPASPNHHSRLSYHALPMETMMVNTIGTHNMLQLAEKNNASFLFTSTSEIYGDPLEHPQKEDYRGNVSTTGPRSVYDEAKRFGETLTAYYHRDLHLNTRIARIFNTYGPRMAKDDMRMIINFILEAIEGKPITVFGNGKQTRSLCYVDDMVDGLIKLMFTPNISGETVNLGVPEERTVLEYAQLVKKLVNSPSEITFSEELPTDDPKLRCPDITKARQLLSWSAKVSLEEGLTKMISYIKTLT